jgi:hypothetical protein
MSNEDRKFSGYLYFTRAVNTHDTYSQAADTIRGRKPKSKKKMNQEKSKSSASLYKRKYSLKEIQLYGQLQYGQVSKPAVQAIFSFRGMNLIFIFLHFTIPIAK